MAKKKASTGVFDPVKFGTFLRNERRQAGFSNTKELSKALQEKTGTFVDFDTLLKFERGEREPDVSKLIALAIVIYGDKWDIGLVSLALKSMPALYKSLPFMKDSILSSLDRKYQARESIIDLELALKKSMIIAEASNLCGLNYAETERLVYSEAALALKPGDTVPESEIEDLKRLGLMDEIGRLVERENVSITSDGRVIGTDEETGDIYF